MTWDTRPTRLFPSSPPSSPAVGGTYSEWTVTPFVSAWLGSTPNNGFVVRSPGPFFYASRESGKPPELVLSVTLGDDPDSQNNPNNPFYDLGDAPDDTNHHGIANTAYSSPNTPGKFPTVRDPGAGTPIGPRHRNETAEGYLGDVITRETDGEADRGLDADPVNNILNGGASNVADKDRGDDGWRNPGVPLSTASAPR